MSGGGASVTVEPISKDAAQCWGLEAVKEHNTAQQGINDAYQVVLGIIGTIGLFRQWDALDRSLDIAERHVAVAEDYYALSERHYEEVALDAYTCQKELFQKYVDDFADCGKLFVDTAKAEVTYTPDFALHEGRAMAGVGAQFSRLRLRRNRQRAKFNTGECCAETLMLDVAQAVALTDAGNAGYVYEDQRRIQLDQWFWARFESAANFISQMRATVVSGVNGGVANTTGAIGAIGGAVGRLGEATRMQQDALNNMASFWGSISNGAFRMMGGMQGYGAGGGASPFAGATMGPQMPAMGDFVGGAKAGGLTGNPGHMTGGQFTPFGSSIRDPVIVPGGFNKGYATSLGYT
jgi:hypothetical protein